MFVHTKMALMERIQKDLTAAMMSKDELRLSVLRMVKSALKYKEIEKVRPLEDAESLQVLQTHILNHPPQADRREAPEVAAILIDVPLDGKAIRIRDESHYRFVPKFR